MQAPAVTIGTPRVAVACGTAQGVDGALAPAAAAGALGAYHDGTPVPPPPVMRIAVFAPADIPTSFVVYFKRVHAALQQKGVDCVRFGHGDRLPPNCDLVWDVRSGGGNPPPDALLADGMPPLVVTVHGFAPLSLPAMAYYRLWRERVESIGHVRRQQRRWAAAQHHIARVIAVSSFTRGECVRHAGIGLARISVCHHGVDADAFAAGAAVSAREPGMLLHVSNDEPRKNLNRVLRAFRQVRRSHPAARLVLKLPAEAAARYSGHSGVEVLTGHLPTPELADLYARASAFVFPSLYEGFGMPILEAMAAGCPVLTSNVSACPEVAGEDALCVDPWSVSDLAIGMVRLLDDASLRDRLAQAGRVRASRFTWQVCAEGHLTAFEQALQRAGAAA